MRLTGLCLFVQQQYIFAIQVAEALSLNDDDVIAALTNLMHDSCWKVKAHAIRGKGVYLN